MTKKSLPYLGVAAVAFLVGNYWPWQFSSDQSNQRPHHDHSKEVARFETGCKLYPEDPICVAERQLPKDESLAEDASECFVPAGYQVDPERKFFLLPTACRELGPLGIGLEELRGGDNDLPKPVTDIPDVLRSDYETADAMLTTRNGLFTFMTVLKANKEEMPKTSDNPEFASALIEVSTLPADAMSPEERKTVGQMLRLYNAFVEMMTKEREDQRQKVAKECTSYQDRELIPIRCAVLASAPPVSTHL